MRKPTAKKEEEKVPEENPEEPQTFIKEIFADPSQQILNDKLNHITGLLYKIAEACEVDLSKQ